MKAILTFAIALGVVSPAQAVVQIFFTSSTQPFGLTNPNLAFQPTQAYPPAPAIDSTHYQVAAFPPISAWGEAPIVNPFLGEYAYIWARFADEPTDVRIIGLHLSAWDEMTEISYYVMNDVEGPSGLRRWDGPYSPGAPEFKQDPQILAAVQQGGIRNAAEPTHAWNLYDSTTRTALLGAVRSELCGLRMLSLGSLGIVLRPVSGPVYPGSAAFGQAWWFPEPASALLVGVLALVLLRRA